MEKRRFASKTDPETGIRFVFKYDPDDPTVLHIYARHGTTVADAIATFKTGVTAWNDQYGRFETLSETHGLFWYWIEEARVVMVITCFGRSEFKWTSG